MLVARAMVTAAPAGAGARNESHWPERAVALLAPLLHATYLHGRPVGDVLGWALGHDLAEPAGLLSPARMFRYVGEGVLALAVLVYAVATASS